ncbi:MAG: H4MPT-linked C1 transfer pathway protein [Isosphaeraceae bacterium]|nr:H4MPT-linked C1 transfer pathway protein [Isosphaeraceae bacterium]
MMMTSPRWIALDIGGANIKAAHSLGQARSQPFELWKHPEDLPRILSTLTATLPPADRVAVTMTAELCDCFPTKAEGVREVLAAMTQVYDERQVWVWGTDEDFHNIAEVLDQPELAAASNWLALATLAARLVPEGPGLLIDIGTTTTDLIPLRDGRPVPRGRTDTQRLRTGELVYAGVRRTPVCALAAELPWKGVPTGLSAELFATTLDIYLTLGALQPDPIDDATADGRPATVEAARDRLARMVGADRTTFSAEDARAFALAADAALMARLVAAAERACLDTIGRPRAAVVAGSGSFLARRLAERVIEPGGTIIELDRAWGPVASSAGCAYALVVLAAERVGHVEAAP